ncbi:MAG: hypothetical protein EON59_05070 [Alphaproteobacteria bacterium]|nr:MAG: hypothetical protein EON59_05070 [Alphaproteobacteria bacterium]
MSARIARTGWLIAASPLSLMFALPCLLMWPLVLQNDGWILALIAYVIALPALPLLWCRHNVFGIGLVAFASLGLQLAAVGIINFWF